MRMIYHCVDAKITQITRKKIIEVIWILKPSFVPHPSYRIAYLEPFIVAWDVCTFTLCSSYSIRECLTQSYSNIQQLMLITVVDNLPNAPFRCQFITVTYFIFGPRRIEWNFNAGDDQVLKLSWCDNLFSQTMSYWLLKLFGLSVT